MLPRYTDFVKDIALSCNILNAIGGPSAMYQFPKQFGPAIVFVMLLSTFYPMILANLETLIEDKENLIFLKNKKRNGRMKKMLIILANCAIFSRDSDLTTTNVSPFV